VVHNRAEVAAPWRVYRRQGNSLFRLYSVFYVFSLITATGFAVFALVYCWGDLVDFHLRPLTEYLPLFIALGALLAIWIPLGILMFLYRELSVPLMYVSEVTAWQAARKFFVLATEKPLDFFVYLVLRMLMGIVFLLVAVTMGCLTCCLGFLPYLSVVVTLPLRVFRQAFTLDCLAQFGPEFDLWSVVNRPPVLPES